MPGLPQLDRTIVMGVLNVTPDSFSDGGEFLDTASAVTQGMRLASEGADLVDVGGESTRPGAARASVDTELARVIPVIEQLAQNGVAVSIDTMRAEVARAAVRAGAVVVNDVSGGLADAAMLDTVADLGVGYVLMHWRGHSDHMAELADYDDVVTEVIQELATRLQAARAAGIKDTDIVLDPGLGFAKTADHNWALVAALPRLATLGQPVLIGASRKRFLGELLADADGPRDVRQREDAGVAITALLAREGVWGIRSHHVRAHRDAIAVANRFAALG